MTEENITFEFKRTDPDGCVNTLKFNAETWTEALERFVQFLRGCGYSLDYDSIGVNADKHPPYGDSDSLLRYFHTEDIERGEVPWDMGFPGIDESMIPNQAGSDGCNNNCCNNRCFNSNQYGGNE